MLKSILKQQGVTSLTKQQQKTVTGGILGDLVAVCGPEDLACIGFDILTCVKGRWTCVANPNDPNNPQAS